MQENEELRRVNSVLLSLFHGCSYMTAEDAVDVVTGVRRATHVLMTHLLRAIAHCSTENCGCRLRREIEEKGIGHFARGDGGLYAMLYEIAEHPAMCWCKTKRIKPCKHCDDDCKSKAPALVTELDPPFSVGERVQARLDRHVRRQGNVRRLSPREMPCRLAVRARRVSKKRARQLLRRVGRQLGLLRGPVLERPSYHWRHWRD